ncbi:alpha/beta hydrolase [Citricoccus sp. I39-566]|uniref:alpha/beta hydrolase n=1 Tax=Citricoccus sp. I39-566 TaxID=3073268 RepID=UPI00286CE813|nr:alpha/beta hydrolase [Citricoccus sp. I39-566]WMY78357.1 alpha/beta hydrolase [Citricoccus sp. I39-566]
MPGERGDGRLWDAAERRATRERLRVDMRRRSSLGPRQTSALDGLVHALKPDSMSRSYPERQLLDYDLGTARFPPSAVVAVGEPEGATQMTWQVSGMGIFVHNAMWGSVREAAQLWAAQREAGASRPCVVAWLGYHPPGPWGALTGRTALRGGARLARHLEGWFEYRDRHGAPPPHTALEAHSYGTVVAACALQILQRREPPLSLDALVVSGAVGLPRDLAEDPDALGLREDQVYFALAETDYLSRAGFWLSRRRPWKRVTRLDVHADEQRNLAGAVGHNTSRHRPDSGLFGRGHGYRDVGTASLHRIARATAGLPLD